MTEDETPSRGIETTEPRDWRAIADAVYGFAKAERDRNDKLLRKGSKTNIG
jgi:hypothetical protein